MWNKCNENAKVVVENECPYCHKKLLMNKKSFANHVRWCDENPKKEEIRQNTIRKIKINNKLRNEEKFGKLKEFEVKCSNPKCDNTFYVNEYEKKFPSKEKYFCSRSCANSHNLSEETKKKISESLIKYSEATGKNRRFLLETEGRACLNCGEVFYTKKINQRFCCASCARRYNEKERYKELFKNCNDDLEKNKLLLKIYKKQCGFLFSLNEYPKEFDFNLVTENGWYKPKNKGNNLNGVSRDHMFSVTEGFREKVDPYLISHPANCKLLLHNDNVSKLDKCSITKEELCDRVNKWNEKYGEYKNNINYYMIEDFKMGSYPLCFASS